MDAYLTHVAFNADDVEASKQFYEAVFGWTFEAWGPPGFYRARTDPPEDAEIIVALQSRRALLEDLPTTGGEVTIAVEDVTATAVAVVESGGRMLMEPAAIPGVGVVIAFEDPGGNPVLAIEYRA